MKLAGSTAMSSSSSVRLRSRGELQRFNLGRKNSFSPTAVVTQPDSEFLSATCRFGSLDRCKKRRGKLLVATKDF
jgi:hypothetical protein